MLEALSPLFVGPLAYLAQKLLPSDAAPDALPGAALLRTAVLEEQVARFADTYPTADRRAVVSMWSQWYCSALVIPAVAAALLLRRALPVGLREVGLVIGERGYPTALSLPHAGPLVSDVFQAVAPLVRQHLEPLIACAAPHFRVSPRLLWANAANLAEWIAGEIVKVPEAPAGTAEAVERLFHSPAWPDGGVNPLFDLVRYPCEGGEPLRRRRLCCLRYLLPEVAHCGSLCPLPAVRRR